MMRMHQVPFSYGFLVKNAQKCAAWLRRTLEAGDEPERVHCKRGAKSAGIVFDTIAKWHDFVARFKDDGLPNSVNSLFSSTTSTILVLQSRSPELREIGRRFARLWKALATKLQDVVLNVFNRRFGMEYQFSSLLRLDTKSCLTSLLLVCVLHLSDEVLQHMVSEGSTPAQNRTTNV